MAQIKVETKRYVQEVAIGNVTSTTKKELESNIKELQSKSIQNVRQKQKLGSNMKQHIMKKKGERSSKSRSHRGMGGKKISIDQEPKSTKGGKKAEGTHDLKSIYIIYIPHPSYIIIYIGKKPIGERFKRPPPQKVRKLSEEQASDDSSSESESSSNSTNSDSSIDSKKNNSEEDSIYCICDGKVHDEKWIGCDNDNCERQWFHYSCVKITAPPSGKWFCPQCKKR